MRCPARQDAARRLSMPRESGQNDFAIGHGVFLSRHSSRKVFFASGGNERVFVQARNGSKTVPWTKRCNGCAMRPMLAPAI